MQDPCLSFAPSPKFTLLESVLASDDVLATFSDPTQVSKLFGHTVGGILKSERLCSIQQMALVLQWVVQQAAACQQHLQAHPLKLLPTLRASQSDQSSSHAAISTSLCCQLLCAMLLDCFDDSSRPGNGKWPHCNFEDILRSKSSLLNNPASSTVHCIMQYFVSVHASLSGPRPLASDASFIVLHRSAISPNSSLRRADTWAKMELPLCPVVISRGSLDPRISEGHVVVDFANKVIGGGVLSGGNVQEEIMFSKHPEAIVTCLLCEQMYKTESIMIYGVRCFSECEGYGGNFTFLRGAQPPSPSAITTVLGYSVAATAGCSIACAPCYQPSHICHSSCNRRQVCRAAHALAAAPRYVHARHSQSVGWFLVCCNRACCRLQAHLQRRMGMRYIQRRSLCEVLGSGLGACV